MVKIKRKPIFFCLSLLALLAAVLHLRAQEVQPEETAAAAESGDIEAYTFTLSPQQVSPAGEYSRQDIESFLCASVPYYIRSEDVARIGKTGKYIVKAKASFANQKKAADHHEINKWFEDQVTVTSKGALTTLDIKAITDFFHQVNRVVGTDKFVYQPGLEAANIVIEWAAPQKIPQVYQFVGETSLLHDNLGVRLTDNDQSMKLKIETYDLGAGKLVTESGIIRLTPAELAFRKDHRLVKVHMKHIADPQVRYFAVIHELLHAIGFTGHSPYYESHLFPLPVRAYNGLLRGLRSGNRVLTPMAERMVEMLYRPEVLPGMSIREAREVLCQLKLAAHTPKPEIIAFLQEQKDRLQDRQNALLEEEEKKYRGKMKTYLELDRLLFREQWLWEEIKEIRSDYGKETGPIVDIARTTSRLQKIVGIRRQLILAENRRKWWSQKINSYRGGRAKQETGRWQEESVVLNDLLVLENWILPLEQKAQAALSSPAQQEVKTTLRRMLRQLSTIDRELAHLQE